MEINPAPDAYILRHKFRVPTETRSIPAIALKKDHGELLVSGYTILVTLVFLVGSHILMWMVEKAYRAKYYPTGYDSFGVLKRNDDLYKAVVDMFKYCWMKWPWKVKRNSESPGPTPDAPATGAAGQGGGITTPKAKRELPPFIWGLLYLIIAVVLIGCNNAFGIVISKFLSIDTVAPVAPHVIFYPNLTDLINAKDPIPSLPKVQGLAGAAALRALGAFGASGEAIRSRVTVSEDPNGLSYSYNVTGFDMGLQLDVKLQQIVQGACRTESSWFNKSASTNETDVYTFWNRKKPYVVPLLTENGAPQEVQGFLHPDFLKQTKDGNVTFAFIIHAAGRKSFTPQVDPWFQTEPMPQNTSDPTAKNRPYRVANERPALVCWEASTWEFKGKKASSQTLDTLPIKLDAFWRDTVFPTEFAAPRILMLARRAGPSALKSASTFMVDETLFDANSSRMYNDMERLIFASWVSTRNVLRDTITTSSESYGFANAAIGPDGQVPKAVAQFVLKSPEVGAFSLRVLIILPSVLSALLVFVFLQSHLSYIKKRSKSKGEDPEGTPRAGGTDPEKEVTPTAGATNTRNETISTATEDSIENQRN